MSEAFKRRFRPPFLHKAQYSVQSYHEQDCHRVDDFAQVVGYASSGQQDEHQKTGELPGKDGDRRYGLGRWKFVPPVLGAQSVYVARLQSGACVRRFF